MSARPGILSGRRVLIVEDRYLIASALESDIIRMGGVVAGPASSVGAAHDILSAETVDLALLDVNLEGESVFPVAERLVGQDTPFLFVTGYDDWEWPATWADRPRIAKPVSARALEAKLSTLLDKA